MFNSLQIAYRNAFRNKRRTFLSILAIAIGGFASLVIGSFVNSVNQGIQTQTARDSGHIHIHKKGYFDFGLGKVDKYTINDYKNVMHMIEQSPISKKIAIMTPVLNISGIAGNYGKNASQTFLGMGQNYRDQLKMQEWDGYNIDMPAPHMPIDATSKNAYIGKGLATNLNLCDALHIKGCVEEKIETNTNPIDDDISDFLDDTTEQSDEARVSLLVASNHGAPNIANLKVDAVWAKTQKNLDDMFLALPLKEAQILLYGEENNKASAIHIQLKSYDDMNKVIMALKHLFRENNLDLEIIDLQTFNPEVQKVIGIFAVIFGFVSIIIGLIVVFTISNTMTMSIMERFNEIGTLRSMGLRRSMIRRYFVLEGSIIGVVGASLGVVLAYLSTFIINQVGLMWSPPNTAVETQLVLSMDSIAMVIFIWLFLVLVSTVSSLLPAIRASKMAIVDALRHN
jgi:putative ABC transport system permease protein